MKLTMTLLAAVAMLGFNWLNRARPKVTSYASRVEGSADARIPEPRSGAPQSYADVLDRVSPAVVTIRSSRRVRAPQQFPFAEDPFFRRFFGLPPGSSRGGAPVERGLGSG